MSTPPTTSNATSRAWNDLQTVALAYFRELHSSHQEWNMEDLLAALHIQETALMRRLAQRAGFQTREAPTNSELCAVAALFMRGVWSNETIAKETGIDGERVKSILSIQHLGFGVGAYGKVPYGGGRAVSDGKTEVPRRVTVSGQLSYRGFLYTLGTAYGGRIARVLEQGDRLHVRFADRPPLVLSRRQYKPA